MPLIPDKAAFQNSLSGLALVTYQIPGKDKRAEHWVRPAWRHLKSRCSK